MTDQSKEPQNSIDVATHNNHLGVASQWLRRRWLWLLCGAGLAVVGILMWTSRPPLPAGVSRSDYQSAADAFAMKHRHSGDDHDILMTLAETLARDGKSDVAIGCYQKIPTSHVRYGPSARYEEALILVNTDRVQRAEDSFRAFLSLQERGIRLPERQVILSRHWLSLILAVELRMEEARIVLHQIMQDHQADIHDVKQYYFPTLLIWQSSFASGRLRDFLKLDPANRHLRNAEARYLFGEGRLKEARDQLRKLCQEDSQDLRSQSFLLACLLEMNDWASFSAAYADVPPFREDEPWLLTEMRGEWALHQKDWADAERMFQHVIRADPPNPVCHQGLAAALAGQGRTAEREVLLQRTLVIAKLRVALSAVSHVNVRPARSIAELSRQLGMDSAGAIFDFFADGMPKEEK